MTITVCGAIAAAAGIISGQPSVGIPAAAGAYGHVPLTFEANRGQVDPSVRFLARGAASSLCLLDAKIILAFEKGSIQIALEGANPSAAVEGVDPLPGQSNYFRPTHKITGIPNFAGVRYRGVWPGVDLIFRSSDRDPQQVEYDFVLAPKADPRALRLRFSGMTAMGVNAQGDLVIKGPGGEFLQHRPETYQRIAGRKSAVRSRYIVKSDGRVTIALGRYNSNYPLVVDPVLGYSTFLGTAYSALRALSVDAEGNAYLAGASGPDANLHPFPTTAGAYQSASGDGSYILKLNPTGTALVYSTYFQFTGGGCGITITSLAVDSTGNAIVGGQICGGLPVTAGALQPTPHGGADGFVAKLNTTGSALVFATYLGGAGTEAVQMLAVDSSGSIYAAGNTTSADFFTTNGAYRRDPSNGFLTKLASTGTAVFFSTYIGAGGTPRTIAVDASGNTYLAGDVSVAGYPTIPGALRTTFAGARFVGDISVDGFVTKFNAAGSGLVYSTFLGGSQGGDTYLINLPTSIAVDSAGNAYVGGYTTSGNFPVTAGAFQPTYRGKNDAFISKLNPAGSALLYSTYLGGQEAEFGWSAAVDNGGNILLTGRTQSADFPTAEVPIVPAFTGSAGTDLNTFIAKIDPSKSGVASLAWSTFLNKGEGRAIATDLAGAVYVAGYSNSLVFPTTPGAFRTANPNSPAALAATYLAKLNPAGVQCTYALGSPGQSFTSAAGNGSIAISTPPGCVWNVLDVPGWVTLTSSGGGTGNGSVTYSVAMNGTSLSRTAVLKIASETYTITQPAFSCDLAIVPGGKAFAAAGASDTVTVTGNPVCAWTAVSNAAWISVTGGASGAGGGTVNYTVAANSGAARTGTLTIAGVTFTVTQSGPVVAGGGLRFVPVTPCRAADTRDALLGAYGAPSMAAGAVRAFNLPQKAGCNIPATAAAYSINVTVVPKEPLGYLTIFPTGAAQPFVSTLNSLDARIKANAAIVPAGTNGEVSVYANNATDVILDVNGYFVDPAVNGAALAYYPITPCRIADTRNANGSLGGPILAAGASRNFPVLAAPCGVPSTAQAYSLNATVVPPAPLGFLTLWPTGQAQPNVSTLNAPTGAITANAAIVPAGAGGQVSAFMSSNSHLVLDINGYFAPPGAANAQRFFAVTPCRLVDTRNAAGEFGGPVLTGGATRTYRLPLAACGLPAGAQALSLNATVVPGSAGLGFLTLWPAGATQPLVSTLNAIDGSITANAAVVPAGTAGAVASFANNQTHLILDTNGYFAP